MHKRGYCLLEHCCIWNLDAMAHQHYRSPFGDTTYTKLFVGGLAWETPTEAMRSYFEQFGEILEAVIITDKNTGKSKGYGFVTFREPESARRACVDPNPVIDGRRANCNIASLGRPRPSPPRARNQGGNPYHGGGIGQGASPSSSSYSGGVLPPSAQLAPPPAPVVPPVMYPPYGYATYPPDYGYSQAFYNPQLQQQQQYYPQTYGSTSPMGSPYFYGGYPAQPTRGTFPAPQAHRMQGPSYLYYPTQMEGSFSPFPSPPRLHLPLQSPQTRISLPSPTDSQTPQHTTAETEVAAVGTSESPKT